MLMNDECNRIPGFCEIRPVSHDGLGKFDFVFGILQRSVHRHTEHPLNTQPNNYC